MSVDRFVGNWRLVYCEYVLPDGQTSYPFGPALRGTLTCDAEGRIVVTLDEAIVDLVLMSAQLVAPGVASSLVPHPDTPGRDITFSGRYTVAETHLIHHFELSPVPAWRGITSRQPYAFRNNCLIISANGASLPGVLSFIWKRAEATD
jgi:hypothetical protein